MKRIGVLTSGGDAPGMNAAIRAVVRTAATLGIEVKGIRRGYDGLIKGEMIDLDARSVSDVIDKGGTMLYSARSSLFMTDEGQKMAMENCIKNGIEGLVVIGGDGTFKGARSLANKGLPCVCIPGTIDNDVASTEYTIGFDTAMNTAMEMIDKIRDTAQSHARCSVIEVMGRHAGHLALRTGIAVGASAILVPEIPTDIEGVIAKMNEVQKMGKKHFIIVVAEGVGGVEELTARIEKETGIESRATILGHVQRGGSPTVRDRVIATQMGNAAVHLLQDGVFNRVVAYKEGRIVDYDIYEALQMTKSFMPGMLEVAYETAI